MGSRILGPDFLEGSSGLHGSEADHLSEIALWELPSSKNPTWAPLQNWALLRRSLGVFVSGRCDISRGYEKPRKKKYIYIYIYAVRLLSGPSLALLEVIIWSKFVFFSKTPIAKKHYKIGVSALFFWKKNCAQKIWKLLSGPSWRFLRCSQLGPDNNFQLGPDNNFQKCHFVVILCFEKCAKMPIFIVFFEKQPKKCKKKCQKKNDNFWHFAKHRFIKKKTRFVATPLFLKKCVFQLVFLKPKTMMLNKKHNPKSGKKQR